MQIAIALFDHLTALDAMGPYSVLSLMPDTEVVLCAERAGRVTDDHGLLRIDVDASFDEVPAPDVLVVPGGFITREMSVPGDAVVEWVRRARPGARFTTSVCTGALLLGAARVLEGRRATTHWRARGELRGFGAHPTAERVVRDGDVITAAGVSSGIDMALELAGILQGDTVAQAIQLGIEYDPRPPHDTGSPDQAPAEVVELVRSVLG